MDGAISNRSLNEADLRKRNVAQKAPVEEVRGMVHDLNASGEVQVEDETKRKTYGRTPDGTSKYTTVATRPTRIE